MIGEIITKTGSRRASTGTVNARTLITIRWVAIAGQITAILIVAFVLRFQLPLHICVGIVSISALLNLCFQVLIPDHKRLSDQWASTSLGFDIIQMAALLYATGGMENPFVLLIVAQETVSATVLSLRSTILLSLITLLAAVFLVFYHLPLPWQSQGIELPKLYIYGIGTALIIAILFTTAYTWRVANEARLMSDALAATQMALSREQQLSALGGLAAAAAHQLGSPLSTIAVIAAELAREVPNDNEFFEDVKLLQSESNRCREILASLSQSPRSADDNPFPKVPISILIELAATPHQHSKIEVVIEKYNTELFAEETLRNIPEPTVTRTPELLHGLSTLIQNAIQFAQSAVEISVAWDSQTVSITIEDDGPGFPISMMDRLGEPYLSTRSDNTDHMGLGIFIAKTLISRNNGRIDFQNRDEGGAKVKIHWEKSELVK